MTRPLFIPTENPLIKERFLGWATVTNTQWRAWRVPAGLTMLSFLVIGGGGSGAGGANSAGGNATGAGGGGSSGVTRLLIQSRFLPEVIYLQVGAGGASVAGNVAGNPGILSYVAANPNTTASNIFAVSGAAAPGGGVVAGTGGVAGTIAVIAAMPLAGLGVYNMIAGQVGTAGALVGAGVSQTIPVTSVITMGGVAGGGCSAVAGFNGGGITAITGSLLSTYCPAVGGPLGTGVAGQNGSGGFEILFPHFFTPGLGGGGSNTNTAGNGGNAYIGSGGGGGGTANGAVGGRGGTGGQGLIEITGW